MKRRCRTFVLWAMVLLMPLQAVAASVMQMCMHQHAAAPVSEAMAPELSDNTSHHGQAAAAHGDCHGTAVSADGVDDERSASTSKPTCSACAACCAMFGLPLPTALPTLAGVTQAQPAYAGAAWVSEQPVRLDRPPRRSPHA